MLKPKTFILDPYRHFAVRRTTAVDVNALGRVLSIAVDDGIQKCLTQCQFNFQVVLVCPSEPRNEALQLIYDRRDDADVTRKCVAQLNKRNGAI